MDENTEFSDSELLDPLGSSPKKIRVTQSNNFTVEEKELIFGKFVKLNQNMSIWLLSDPDVNRSHRLLIVTEFDLIDIRNYAQIFDFNLNLNFRYDRKCRQQINEYGTNVTGNENPIG